MLISSLVELIFLLHLFRGRADLSHDAGDEYSAASRVPGVEELADIIPGRRLTQEKFQHWTNGILISSIKESLPAGRLQHFPATYDQAYFNSRANFVEARSSMSTAPQQQNLQYKIPAEYLGPIQQAIWRRVQEPGNQEFRNELSSK